MNEWTQTRKVQILLGIKKNCCLKCCSISQGWLKSTRNSYLNTGSFPRNHIWMCGVLKKSIFAYLKFHICIPKILHSCYHRPYRPCPNFSVPASVKARSSLVYNVFHQIGKIITSGILGKGYEFWQGLWAKLILE